MVTNIIYVSDPLNLEIAREEILKCRVLGVDTETTGLDPHKDKICLVQIATVNHCFVINVAKVGKAQLINRVLRPLLQDEKIVKIIHNAKFDIKFFASDFDLDTRQIKGVYDTYVIARLCVGGLDDKCGLKELAADHLGIDLPKENQTYNWAGELYREQVIYAGLDAAILFPLKRILDRAIDDNRLHKAAKLELDAVTAFAQLELNGVLVDKKKWTKLANDSKKELDKAEKILRSYIGNDINLRSHKQVCMALSELTGMNITSRSKDAIKELLETYEPRPGLFNTPDHRPLFEALQTWSQHNTHQTRYGLSFLEHINEITGRIHSNFWQISTETGRTSSSKPNLQNITRDSEMRAAFIAAKGNKLGKWDYSQIELRLLAQLSGDAAMQASFRNKEDLHTATAIEVFGDPERRQDAKAISFGVPYGQKAQGLAAKTGMSIREAEQKLRAYYNAHPEMVDWFDSQIEYLKRFDCIRTPSGRMRAVPFWRRGRNKEFEAMQASRNSPIQGGSADILKRAMTLAHNELPDHWKMVLQVHDELVWEFPTEDSDEAETRIPEIMVRAGAEFMPDVECVVEGNISNVWKK